MKQERLNNLMIHKEHTDKLDLANDFVSGDQHRCYLPQNGWVRWVGVALALPL